MSKLRRKYPGLEWRLIGSITPTTPSEANRVAAQLKFLWRVSIWLSRFSGPRSRPERMWILVRDKQTSHGNPKQGKISERFATIYTLNMTLLKE